MAGLSVLPAMRESLSAVAVCLGDERMLLSAGATGNEALL
ncbi:hypothetical protein METHPM2_560045 [Pseudomonas sp. PM2]